MNGMKCGKKGEQKLILEFTGSCRGEFFFLIGWLKKKFHRGRLEISGGISSERFRSCGIGMLGEWVKK